MKLKKTNAAISLLLIGLMIVHIVYELWSYLSFYYNPLITSVIGYGFAAVVLCHIILSVTAVFIKHDGSTLRMYPKANIGTIFQRASALVILVLFPVHIKTGDLIAKHAGGTGLLALLIVLQLLFWAALFTHITLSLSRAFVTLGVIQQIRTRKTVDLITAVLCVIGFIAAAVIVIRVQLFLFYQ